MKRFYLLFILVVPMLWVCGALALVPQNILHMEDKKVAFPLPTKSLGTVKKLNIQNVIVSEADNEIIINVGNGVKLFFQRDGYYKVQLNEDFLFDNGELSHIPIINCVKNSFEVLQPYKINNTNISSFVPGVDISKYGFSYHFIKREINNNEVALHFLSSNGKIELVVKIVPATFNISGQNWYGYGISYKILRCDKQIVSLRCSNVWNLGGRISEHYTWFHSPYSRKRGFGKYFMEPNSALQGSNYSNMFFAGQSFNIVVGDSYSLLSCKSTPKLFFKFFCQTIHYCKFYIHN